jgi:hypothetical protein
MNRRKLSVWVRASRPEDDVMDDAREEVISDRRFGVDLGREIQNPCPILHLS